MEKALNVLYALREAVSLSKNYPSDEILDEAIAELEEAMKPKTCDGCKFKNNVKFVQVENETLECCSVCVRQFEADYFVKDNA